MWVAETEIFKIWATCRSAFSQDFLVVFEQKCTPEKIELSWTRFTVILVASSSVDRRERGCECGRQIALHGRRC